MMNAVEMEAALAELAKQPFDPEEFPYDFLEAFGNKPTTLKRLRSGSSNRSDVGGVLQAYNIHIRVCDKDTVTKTLSELKNSPATTKAKAKIVLATDGSWLEAEDINTGETVACELSDVHERFGFFLQLAGITKVKEIRESSFDKKATVRMNNLYVELSKTNPEWGCEENSFDLNQFFAQLIFCYFAEDTDIFGSRDLFTATVEQMSAIDSSNTHEVIREIFKAMSVQDRAGLGFRPWATKFPYVNGGLFSESVDVPKISKMARSYIIHIGKLDWRKVNPDIFGSMIQTVADEEERGAIGMHYTSVSNILRVLNPLFLDSLQKQLDDAGDSPVKLLNLRKRMSNIRVFDPACGSGNFLVIAYKEMRRIEAEINRRRNEIDRRTEIPLTNFRGIKIREFPAEISRLALVIANYQCDVLYRGQKEALKELLPLDQRNWITCGNALRLDWTKLCPPKGKSSQKTSDDLLQKPDEEDNVSFSSTGEGEVYICGNPPYTGYTLQTIEQKDDLKYVFGKYCADSLKQHMSIDYVSAWFIKAADYANRSSAHVAFVATNSICQGLSVSKFWPSMFELGARISFAHTTFRWSNLANHNAGVSVVIVGITANEVSKPVIYSIDEEGNTTAKHVNFINPDLSPGSFRVVSPTKTPISNLPNMVFGNMPRDGGHFLLSFAEASKLKENLGTSSSKIFLRNLVGSVEFVRGIVRKCIWIEDGEVKKANKVPYINERIKAVRMFRKKSTGKSTRSYSDSPHRFVEIRVGKGKSTIVIPSVTSEKRNYVPAGLLPSDYIVPNSAFAIYDQPLWNMALIASRLHLVWIKTVCGKLETRIRYSNTLGWNTFPVPMLTTKNKDDLTRAAEYILLAREEHYPATIVDLYKPDAMPENLRIAHEQNDEIIERIYIGRRFKNDTERLEKLFELYSKITNGNNNSNQQGTQK